MDKATKESADSSRELHKRTRELASSSGELDRWVKEPANSSFLLSPRPNASARARASEGHAGFSFGP